LGIYFGNLFWASALASPVTFLTGDHVVQIGFGQISPSGSEIKKKLGLNGEFVSQADFRLRLLIRALFKRPFC